MVSNAPPTESSSTTPPPPLTLSQPAFSPTFADADNETHFLIKADTYDITPPTEAFRITPSTSAPSSTDIHYHFSYLSPTALRVRFGFAAVHEHMDDFPDDADFPPPHVEDLFSPESDIPETDMEAGAGGFSKWPLPRHSGLEIRHAEEEGGNLYFEAYRGGDEKPFWKESPRGPFSHGSLPVGVGSAGDERRCFELFALEVGENMYVGTSKVGTQGEERVPEGLVRAEVIHSDILRGEGGGRACGAEIVGEGTGLGEEAVPMKTSAEDGQLSKLGHWTGSYPVKLPDDLFFWTDRGWGCLVRKPALVSQEFLQGPLGVRGLVSVVCEGDYMDFILVCGEALERVRGEYL